MKVKKMKMISWLVASIGVGMCVGGVWMLQTQKHKFGLDTCQNPAFTEIWFIDKKGSNLDKSIALKNCQKGSCYLDPPIRFSLKNICIENGPFIANRIQMKTDPPSFILYMQKKGENYQFVYPVQLDSSARIGKVDEFLRGEFKNYFLTSYYYYLLNKSFHWQGKSADLFTMTLSYFDWNNVSKVFGAKVLCVNKKLPGTFQVLDVDDKTTRMENCGKGVCQLASPRKFTLRDDCEKQEEHVITSMQVRKNPPAFITHTQDGYRIIYPVNTGSLGISGVVDNILQYVYDSLIYPNENIQWKEKTAIGDEIHVEITIWEKIMKVFGV